MKSSSELAGSFEGLIYIYAPRCGKCDSRTMEPHVPDKPMICSRVVDSHGFSQHCGRGSCGDSIPAGEHVHMCAKCGFPFCNECWEREQNYATVRNMFQIACKTICTATKESKEKYQRIAKEHYRNPSKQGCVDIEEFRKVLKAKFPGDIDWIKELTDEDLDKFFHVVDADMRDFEPRQLNGGLDREQFREVMTGFGVAKSNKDFNRLFEAVDADGNGAVDTKELCDFLFAD